MGDSEAAGFGAKMPDTKIIHESAPSAMKWLLCMQEWRNPCKSPREPLTCLAPRNVGSGGKLLAPIDIAEQ